MAVLNSDITILDILRKRGELRVGELAELMGVTGTAIRQRLNRLLDEGCIVRATIRSRRGRPSHGYSLTVKGRRRSGENFGDLAIALWQEIRSIEDPEIRHGLLKRISRRMAELYIGEIQGNSVGERMKSLAVVFAERRLPVKVVETDHGAALSVEACPYPDLAEQDPSVCSMERLLFSEILGETLQLTECCLDGGCSCTFQTAGFSHSDASLPII